MSAFCLGGLVAGLIAGKIKERYIFLISAFLFLAGFLLVSTLHSLGQLYMGFGVMAGFGAGLAYNTVMSSVTKWFPDKKGLISGILLMGFGIGAFVIGKVYTWLLEMGSWRMEFKLWGCLVFLVILIGGQFIRKPSEEQIRFYDIDTEKKQDVKGLEYTTKQMLSGSAFWLYFLYAILLSAAALALIAQASGILVDTAPDLQVETIATIVGLISVFNGIGRVAFGGLYDKIGQRYTMLFNCALYLLSVVINIVGLEMGSLGCLVVGYIFFGLSYGGVTPTNSAFIMDYYGAKYYPVNFSIINLNLLVASFGGTLAGMLYDLQGTYVSIFVMMIVAILLATICALLLKRPKEVK